FFIMFFVLYIEFPGFMDSIGLEKREISLLLIGSVVGVLLNVPVVVGESVFLGLNVGGALIPVVLSFHLLWKNKPPLFSIFATVAVTSFLSYITTVFVPNLGVASLFPFYLASPLAAFFMATALEPKRVGKSLALAYSSATLGALIGADLVRIPEIVGVSGGFLGAIGGAGSMDLVFLAGLFSGGLVLFFSPRKLWHVRRKKGEVESHLYPKKLWEKAWDAHRNGKYGLSIQLSRMAVENRIMHTALRYGIADDAEGCLFRMRVEPYMIHDYRVLTSLHADMGNSWRALNTSGFIMNDLAHLERKMYSGMGERLIAFLIDTAIVLLLFSIISLPLITGLLMETNFFSLSSMATISALLGIGWSLQTGYFTILEWLWGQSIGKKLFGMVVMDESGRTCGFMASFTRNVLRILDFMAVIFILTLPFYILAYTRSDMRQRLGDVLAGTVVMKKEKPFPGRAW
ncbi:MAG: DUF1614 domain-containing protein, partial [Candidatus Thermoplasmatota archaeon]|nr:DUF1614 domain-containing protein [Candidatus Thermoplasmatota archaeon]